MSNSLAFIQNGVAVTSSFIISEGVAIQHKNVLELIKKYISDLKTFGNVLFETQSFKTAGGVQKRTANHFASYLFQKHGDSKKVQSCSSSKVL